MSDKMLLTLGKARSLLNEKDVVLAKKVAILNGEGCLQRFGTAIDMIAERNAMLDDDEKKRAFRLISWSTIKWLLGNPHKERAAFISGYYFGLQGTPLGDHPQDFNDDSELDFWCFGWRVGELHSMEIDAT